MAHFLRRRDRTARSLSVEHYSAAVNKALRAAGVFVDYRRPDILRFGITPLYMRYVDVWEAVDALARIIASDGWPPYRAAALDPVT